MELADATTKEALEELYEKAGLKTNDKKVDFLTREMGIKAMRCDEEETPEENLAGLEELALMGDWKALQ
jgi:hypothetical protein